MGTKLIFSSDYSPNYDLYEGTFDNWFLDADNHETIQPLFYISSNVIKNDILSSKLDFIKKTRNAFTLETGIKATSSNMKSSYNLHNKENATGEFILDTSYTNAFSYNEQILAGYISFTKEWDGFSLNGGVRAENTHIVAENKTKTVRYKRDYFNLFPAINLEYSRNEDHNFQLSYNLRIDRPDYNSFNPFKNRNSVFMSNKGNPNLLPEYSNSFELTHTFKGVLSNSFSYSLIDHFLIDLTIQNDSSKETTAYVDNLGQANKYGYSIFYNQPLKKWWTITFNGSASYITTQGKLLGADYSSKGYFYMGSLTNEFLLKSTKLAVNGKYIGPRFNGVWMNGPRWGVSLGVSRFFFKERLNITMGIDDIFFTMVGSNRIKVQNQDWSIVATNDSRRFEINLSYSFGKVKVQERDIKSNEEEKGRLGK
ncbi:MAG: TonB-dependent receptor family protein [Sphingobacteriaceae bacterium]|nr:TonB-dependent receptor family protein [Sphingobacteriaceae bacterium]